MNEGDRHGVDEVLYEVEVEHSISSPIFVDLFCPDWHLTPTHSIPHLPSHGDLLVVFRSSCLLPILPHFQ